MCFEQGLRCDRDAVHGLSSRMQVFTRLACVAHNLGLFLASGELLSRGVDIAAVQRDPTERMQGEVNPAAPNERAAFAAFIRDPAGTLIELLDHAALAKMNMI
jgi:hypothetical protein